MDEFNEGKLNFKKMKAALLHESKLKLNKTQVYHYFLIQILMILNFFNTAETPEIDYYKASLIIRNMIQELFSPSITMQKVEITNNKSLDYENFEDEYDVHTIKMKDVFKIHINLQLYISFDQDYDHLLDKTEFNNFITWMISYLSKEEKEKIFKYVDTNQDGKVSYPEFKEHFKSLVQMTRIKNVLREITKLYDT